MNAGDVEDIIRCVDEYQNGIYRTEIYGLNTLAANHVDTPPDMDPRIVFLKTIAQHSGCAAHVGSLALLDHVDSTRELFAAAVERGQGMFTQIGLHNGDFYQLEPDSEPACFLYEAAVFFQIVDDELALYTVKCDGLAIYVTPTSQSFDEKLLDRPLTSDDWLSTVLDHYRLAILSGGDGFTFMFHSRSPIDTGEFADALQSAERSITSNEWFRKNRDRLHWDSDLNLCLILAENRADSSRN